MTQITINSTVEELKAYVESDEYKAIPFQDITAVDDIMLVALATNEYSFDISFGTTAMDEIVFDIMSDQYEGREVDEGGRWSNFVTNYKKAAVGGEEYYVAMSWEQAATEMQEHGSADVYLVKPVEKTIISYEKI